VETVIIRFKPTDRMGFINNTYMAAGMMRVLNKLDIINITRMSMGDNKLYIYLE